MPITPGACLSAAVLIGGSAAAAYLREAVEQCARGSSPVLLIGPPGSGKAALARAIHARSCADRPFTVVECAALPADLPRTGTLFLDEIDDLPERSQAALLRQLWADGSPGAPADARRIVSATRTPAARLREDLRHLLGAATIVVPGLEARTQDIPCLVGHFARARGTCAPAVRFAPRALARIVAAPWPGHIRGLADFVARAALAVPRGATLGEAAVAALLDPYLALIPPHARAPFDAADMVDLDALLAEVEKRHLGDALARAGGIVAEAARRVGLRRTTFIDRMHKHGLAREAEREPRRRVEPPSIPPLWADGRTRPRGRVQLAAGRLPIGGPP